jgi:hypothetical protein
MPLPLCSYTSSRHPPLPLLCEHSFVGSHGSDYGRFRHALDSGNLTVARAAAAGLEYVGFAEALELILQILEHELETYLRAAPFPGRHPPR